MTEYLVFSPEGKEDDFEPCIIEAESIEAAIERYHLYRVPDDESLKENVVDRSMKSFLVQSLALATVGEQDRFINQGVYDWDKDLIRIRAFDYFPNRRWAQLYSDYLLSDEDEPDIPEFPDEMLAYIRGHDDFTKVAALPLSEIPRF